jgi:hypothetical protein
MGFWDSAFKLTKNIGTVAYNAIEESADNIRAKREKLERMDDNELFRIVHSNSSSMDRPIAFSILKSRGYTPEDIKKRR